MATLDNATTWRLIHQERASVADLLEGLNDDQRAVPSLCGGWSVGLAGAHIVAGAEQTPTNFMRRFISTGFRFDAMVDQDARRLGALEPGEIVRRLRARTTTTNRPPASVTTMLGEVVVHGEDIRLPLGIAGSTPPEAVAACLEMYSKANFPVGTKRRIAGLQLGAPDVGWSHGSGPAVTGPGIALLMAITGRREGLVALSGDGLEVLAGEMAIPEA